MLACHIEGQMVDSPVNSSEGDLALQNKKRTAILLRKALAWCQYRCEPRQHQTNKDVDPSLFDVLRQLPLPSAWRANHIVSDFAYARLHFNHRLQRHAGDRSANQW